jgi:hypothetical protein
MILRGLRDTLEAHHKVAITDEAIAAAAELSDRYITGCPASAPVRQIQGFEERRISGSS